MSHPVLAPDFLSFTRFQKEASLLIYNESSSEHEAFKRKLEAAGFAEASEPLELFQAIKASKTVYIVLSKENAKAVYDIALEYPTGQVSFQNQKTRKTEWADPNYALGSLVIVAEGKLVSELENQGLSFRTITGLAYQTPSRITSNHHHAH